MEFAGIANVASITVICYLVAEAVKTSEMDNKWIPVICGVLGALLGGVGWLFVSGFPAGDFLSALAVGIVSGLAATGANQVYKQITGGDKH